MINTKTFLKHTKFLKAHFKSMENNLTNYYSRTTYEGLMITLNQPILNKQVYHKSTKLVCTCLNMRNSDQGERAINLGTS